MVPAPMASAPMVAAKTAPLPRTGGEILVDALRANGIDTVFCVPGESFLPVIDALHGAADAIRTIVNRHEAAAAHMAEAHGKITGRPGVCIVTRGPGATHAAIGVHTASQDSTPLLLLVGQIDRGMRHREAWQEVDLRQMFSGMAKWVVEIEDTARIPELMARAFHVAVSGRPGPVVVGLPEDMLFETASVADVAPLARSAGHPGADAIARLEAMIAAAERPLVVVGGGGWSAAAAADFTRFAEAFDLPVLAAFRRQDIVDNRSRAYVGHAGLGPTPATLAAIREADLTIAVGARLGETTSLGYTLFGCPTPNVPLVHVHADPHELGRVYAADLAINAGMPEIARALAALEPRTTPTRRARLEAMRAAHLAETTPPPMPGPVDLGAVMVHVRDTLPADTFVSNGAGNYAIWVHRFHRYGGFRTQLAPTSGAMGYGLPAAIAAKLVHPEREAICFAGDGCFLMSAQELATAVLHRVGVVVIVVDNGIYGSIRAHQEKEFPARVHATALANPDFAALAAAHGCHGENVTATADFPAALARARAFARDRQLPAVIALTIDPEAIAPGTTLTRLRDAALARRTS